MDFIRRITAIAAVLVAIILLESSICGVRAANCDPTTLCRTVVPDVLTLQAATTSPGPYITITCYYNGGAASNVCAGGGDFDRGSCGPVPSPNGATELMDSAPTPNCYYRKNFGLNGVVDARQCGVVGDGQPAGVTMPGGAIHPDDGALLNACLLIAAQQGTNPPALQNPIHVVNTGGGVILDNNASIDIPANTELTCGGTGTDTSQGPDVVNDDDYRIGHGITNAIVLDPAYSVLLHHNNSTFSGCNLEAGAGIDNRNPYSPSVYYPKCKQVGTDPCGTEWTNPNLRSSTNEYSAFNPNPTALYNGTTVCESAPPYHCGPASASIGIKLTTAQNLAVRDVTVLGFGTCYGSGLDVDGKAGKVLVIDRLYGDCDTGISVDQASDASHFNTFIIKPYLNRSLGNGSSLQITNVRDLGQDTTIDPTKYVATVQVGGGSSDFQFKQGDTVWIATDSTTGAQSAGGRWTVANNPAGPTTCGGGTASCQKLALAGSLGEPDSQYNTSSSPITLSGMTNNVTSNGIPPNAIFGIVTTPGDTNQIALQLVAVGQSIKNVSGGTCIPAGTTVTDVWPAKGIVYMSAPATCAATESIGFYDTPMPFSNGVLDCVNHPDEGCASVVATERFGDGIVVTNSGGVNAVNCQLYEHLTAFHFSTNANSSRFANCATGENSALPDQDIVGLKIDGSHNPADGGDACGNEFVNGILGQHRTVGILVQSNCDKSNHLSNVRFSGNSGGRRNAIGLEVDAGTVALTNSDASGNDNVFKADATDLYYSVDGETDHVTSPAFLSIGNNQFPRATLYMSDSAAAASTVGCGNTFLAPTPYLCAPSSFTQPPGGRLTLTAGQPVMSTDVVGTNTVYYAPYLSQQVPIHNTASGVFGLADIGSGIQLVLDSSSFPSAHLYDIFAEIDASSGAVTMCTGPAWTSGTARNASGQIAQISGVWANSVSMTCHYNTGTVSGSHSCLPYECTYLGSVYTIAGGQTSQQFQPAAAVGGSLNCLCLYNAYNLVAVTSTSLDSGASYTYATNTWRPMRNTASPQNRITVVDGLGQMQIAAQLNDEMNKTGAAGGSGAMGIDLNSTTATPAAVAQTAATTQGTYQAALTNAPVMGLWFVQAMENAPNGLSATFGGAGFQRLSIQVAD